MFTRLFEILTFISLIIVINYYIKNYSEIGPVGQKVIKEMKVLEDILDLLVLKENKGKLVK